MGQPAGSKEINNTVVFIYMFILCNRCTKDQINEIKPNRLEQKVLIKRITITIKYEEMQPKQGVQHRMVLVVKLFRIFEIIMYCFVGAIFDLVHDVEAIHGL